MKGLLLFLITLIACNVANGQILNGDFENGSNPDLSNWEWNCFAELNNDGAPGGGNWSLKVASGNTQGCFPSYAYQKMPMITNGQTFQLTGWAYAHEALLPVGLYWGKINNGAITLQTGDTTSSTSWKQLSLQETFSLSSGDTAVVVLHAGLAGGPVSSFGYFDLIDVQQVTGVNSLEQHFSLKLFPNPFNNQTTISIDKPLYNGGLTVCNAWGQVVKQVENINNQTIILEREKLSNGLYTIHLSEDGKTIATKKIIISD